MILRILQLPYSLHHSESSQFFELRALFITDSSGLPLANIREWGSVVRRIIQESLEVLVIFLFVI